MEGLHLAWLIIEDFPVTPPKDPRNIRTQTQNIHNHDLNHKNLNKRVSNFQRKNVEVEAQ